MEVTPIDLAPFNWMKDADIYNKKFVPIPPSWFVENADAIVLLFTAKGIDRDGVIERFYIMYEDIKYLNIPVEVIYIPLDETKDDYNQSFKLQANWFTLQFDDPLVHVLKYAYGITCIPHMFVIKPDCSIISSHGILDLERYGKNAFITWMSEASTSKSHRRLSKDISMYGPKWRFVNGCANKSLRRKFSAGSTSTIGTATNAAITCNDNDAVNAYLPSETTGVEGDAIEE